LREEEETTTLTTKLVLLALVGFKNLVAVVGWVQGLNDIDVFDSICFSNVAENLGTV